MKQIRIEIHITAFVHIGDDLTEGLPPQGVPFHREEFTMTRTALLDEGAHRAAVTKAHAVSMLAGMAGVLPDKLAHGARSLPLK